MKLTRTTAFTLSLAVAAAGVSATSEPVHAAPAPEIIDDAGDAGETRAFPAVVGAVLIVEAAVAALSAAYLTGYAQGTAEEQLAQKAPPPETTAGKELEHVLD